MGYDLNIRRINGERISTAEFRRFIAQNSDFYTQSIYEKDAFALSVTSPLYELMFCKINGDEIPFGFYEGRGEISVKNPNQITVDKMIEMADFFKAIVVGEEEEVYSREHPEGKFPEYEEEKTGNVPKLKWWQRLIPKVTPQTEIENRYERMIGADFYFENNAATYQAILNFLHKLDQCNFLEIEKSLYHVEDWGLQGSIREIKRDGHFEVGLIITTKIGSEHIMIISTNHRISVLFSIYNDLEKLEKLIELLDNNNNLLLGSVYNGYDCQWQSEKSIQRYKPNKSVRWKLNYTTNEVDEKCVDTRRHYGRKIYGAGLGFVAGYKNYIGPKIRKKMPDKFWENPIFKVAIFKGEILMTQLHEHPLEDVFSKEIRAKQKTMLAITEVEALLAQFESTKHSEDFSW